MCVQTLTHPHESRDESTEAARMWGPSEADFKHTAETTELRSLANTVCRTRFIPLRVSRHWVLHPIGTAS